MNIPSWNKAQPTLWQIGCAKLLPSWRVCWLPLGFLSLFSGTEDVANAAPPVPIPTYFAQADFRLPFDVGPASRRPKQLDLLVSRDAGVSWRLHQSVPPTARAFEVKDAAEGDYLLTVQARDEATALISQQAMRLVVDRTPPKLNIECAWNGQKSVSVQCSAQDKTLDRSTISLQFRYDNAATYTAIELTSLNENDVEVLAAGLLELPECQRFELLLEARDRAGNKASFSQRFDCPSTESLEQPQPTIASQIPAPTNSQPVASLATHRRAPTQTGVGKEAIAVEDKSSAGGELRIESTSQVNASALSLSAPELSSSSAVPVQQISTNHSQSTSQPNQSENTTLVLFERKFSVAYDLTEQRGGWRSVELWGTSDDGMTWELWGHDEDCVSPCKIEVPRPGKYGYCVVIIHDEADMKLRPQPGDRPDLQVEIREPRRAALSLVR